MDAALINGRCETSDVADHAAAKSDQRGVAVMALSDQGVDNLFDRAQGFECFAVFENHAVVANVGAIQRIFNLVEIQRGDRGVGHDDSAAAQNVISDQCAVIEQVMADEYRVAAISEFDFKSM